MLLEHTTIKEIAGLAKVSTATVSRILSGKSCHRSATVENVRRAVEKLRANSGPLLTGFESSAPESVGLVMFAYRDFLNSDYNATLATAIMEALTAEDFAVQFITLSPKRLGIEYIESLIREHRLKGLLIPEFDMLYAISEKLATLPIPVVCVGNFENCHYRVSSDSVAAGRDAANYLWSCGHRRFGILSMSRSDKCQDMRISGFRDAVRELGGNPDRIWIREYRSLDDSVAGAISTLVNMKEPPTALFSNNSRMTRKLIAGLLKCGRRIPEDISVLSFEENGELEEQPIPVSVIVQPTRRLGEAAVRMLINRIRGVEIVGQQMFNCSLITRESVGGPPQNNTQ